MILLVIILLLLAIAAVYLFFFVRPIGREIPKILLRDYAHRGLWNDSVPENSLRAFDAAAYAGFAMELDVQLTSDKEVVVFHDKNLERMTGCKSDIDSIDYDSATKLRLHGKRDIIPRFRDVLAAVGGRTPILIELKGESTDTTVCDAAAEVLENYKGPVCVESFNPVLLKRWRELRPEDRRGVLYTDFCRSRGVTFTNILLNVMALNFLAKPDFLACDKKYINKLPAKLCRKLFRIPVFVWTIRSKKEFDISRKLGVYSIFEIIN